MKNKRHIQKKKENKPHGPTAAKTSHLPQAEATAAVPVMSQEESVRLVGMSEGMTVGALRRATLQQLQDQHGNAFVQRLLATDIQRQNGDSVDAGPVAGVPTDATADATVIPADLQEFRDHGLFPADPQGQTVVPSTGMGGFNASYDPVGMRLTITVNVGMTFVDGMQVSGSTVTANDPSLAGAANGINNALSRLSGAELAAALAQVQQDWQWAGATDPRIVTFMANYKSTVQSAWSSSGTGIVFQSSKDGWESQLANMDVVVNTTNVTAPTAGAAGGPQPTHCQAQIFKTPEGNTDFGAAVGPGTAASGTDQTLDLGSSQVDTPQQLLTQSVQFAHNSAVLDTNAQNFLRRWIISFQAPAGGSGTTLDIIGRANTVGGGTTAGDEYNRQLSLRRAQAVSDFISNTVVEGRTLANATQRIQSMMGAGSEGATDEAEWRRVDIVAAGGQSQNVAVHEFGHMIGLDDEYASTPQRDAAGNIVTDANGDAISRGLISGTGGDVGDPTGSNQLVQDMGLGSSVAENNDNIMSLGNTIRPQHYATFMEALRTVTNSGDWRLRQ